MRGKHRQPGILQRDKAHEDVAVLALAAQLLGVGVHGLVAMVAVRNQQLRVARGSLDRRDHTGVGDAPQAVAGAVLVCDVAPWPLLGRRRERLPGGAGRVGEQREDGGDVRPRGPGETQPILLRAGVGALVRTHAPGTVVLDPHPAEEAAARAREPVRAGVVLSVGPQCRLAVPEERSLQLPALEQLARRYIGIPPARLALGQINRHHVEGRALQQGRALRRVDHVIRRGDHVRQGTHHRRVIVQRAALLERSPFNVVAVDLPQGEPGGRDPYVSAGQLFESWQLQGALLRDCEPALWAHAQEYTGPDGLSRTRRGFFCRVRIEDYGPGRVRPHERTHPGPKEDRLRLTRATRANVSPIFSLFSDPAGAAWEALAPATEQRPWGDVTDQDSTRHRLWRVSDPRVIAAVQAATSDAELLIADGHHRYETMHAYAE